MDSSSVAEGSDIHWFCQILSHQKAIYSCVRPLKTLDKAIQWQAHGTSIVSRTPDSCGTVTHDYKRQGTTTLFAALNVLDGRVIGECMANQEFLRFLRQLDREFPEGMPLNLIVYNYGTHNQPWD